MTEPGTENEFKRLCDALRECAEEPWSLADVEQYDDYVRSFDLNKASLRDITDVFKENWESTASSAREKLVWEMQRLLAMLQKLGQQRQERHQRLLAIEQSYEEGNNAFRENLDAQEERIKKMEASVARCERMLAAKFPDQDTDVVSARRGPDVTSGSAANTQQTDTASASDGAPGGRPAAPAPTPPGWVAPPAPTPDASRAGRPTPPPPAPVPSHGAQNGSAPPILPPSLMDGPGLPGAARPPPPPIPKQNTWTPQQPPGGKPTNGYAAATAPVVPPGAEGSDASEDEDDNPWGNLG